MNGAVSVEGGMEVMTYLMEECDDINAVFTMVFGVLRVALYVNRNEFVLASADSALFALDVIKQANQPWIVSAVQRTVQMAAKAIEIDMTLLEGRDFPQ